jgi:hypothetical protein
MKNSLHLFIVSVFISANMLLNSSCRRDDFSEVRPTEIVPKFKSGGIWIVNEGLFGWANGEISFIDLQEDTIFNGIFAASNNIQAGDIPFDLLPDEETILLTVNNSDRIWILSKEDFTIKTYLQSIKSPRHIEKYGPNQYAVSSFANDSLYFIDMRESSPVVTAIYTGKSTEKLLYFGNILYAANWSSYGSDPLNNSIQIIDVLNKTLIGSIQVGKEPNSMVKDKNNNIWVLCSGGYMNEENPRLCKISTITNTVISVFEFPLITQSPFSLSVSKDGDYLYYINEHIYRMSIYDYALPTSPLIASDDMNFYSVNASMFADSIVVADAGNYQTAGKVLIYMTTGQEASRFQAGIIPSVMKINP